jgi:hypothetical protein
MSLYQSWRHTAVAVCGVTHYSISNRGRWAVGLTFQPLYDQGRSPGTHSTGGWVGPTASVDIFGGGNNLFLVPKFKLWIIQTHRLVPILTELLQGPWYTLISLIQILLSHLCVCQQVDLEWRFHRKTLLTDRALVRCNTKTHVTETRVLYFTNRTMYQDFRMGGGGGPGTLFLSDASLGHKRDAEEFHTNCLSKQGVPCGPKNVSGDTQVEVCCVGFELTLWWIQCFHDWSCKPWI